MHSNTTRIASADFLKGLSICGVVWIHSYQYGSSSPFAVHAADAFRFCVPVFVTLWAYFYCQRLSTLARSDYPAAIVQRLTKLSIPFLFWSLVHLALSAPAPASLQLGSLVTGTFGGYAWAGQFFFIVLFQWTLLLPWVIGAVTKGSTAACFALSAIGFSAVAYLFWSIDLVGKLGDRPFIYWTPFVFLGIALSKYGIPKCAPWLALISILSLSAIPVEFYFIRQANLSTSPYVIPSVLFSSAALCITALSYSPSNPLATLVSRIGQNSLAIFLLNPIVIRLLMPLLQKQHSRFYVPLLSDLLIPTTVLLLTLLVASSMKRIRLGALIGEPPRRQRQ